MAKPTIAQRNRAVGILQTGMSSQAKSSIVVEGCCTRVKLMSFDHSASLDIISADRQCFGDTRTGCRES